MRGGPGLVQQPVRGALSLLRVRVLAQQELLDGDVPSVLLVQGPPHGAVRPTADAPGEPVTPTDQTYVGQEFAVSTHGT